MDINMKKCCCEANANTYYNVYVWLNERAKNGDKKAQSYLTSFNQVEVVQEIIDWMTELAEQGDEDVQYNLALHYKQTIKDDKKAVEWFTKAADNGCINSCWNLGHYYEYGIGSIEKNIPEAIKWYEKIANRGDTDLSEIAKEKLNELSKSKYGEEK